MISRPGARPGAAEFAGAKAQGHGERGHEERGCGSFAGDVGNDDIDDIFGNLKEVVVVAAEKSGGLHKGGELEAGDDWRFWQDLMLDLCGEDQIAFIFVALPPHF